MIQKDIDLLHSKKLKGVNNSGLMMDFLFDFMED
jgi:hypothetical protein